MGTWTNEEILYLKENAEFKTNLEMSKYLNHSIKGISNKKSRLHLHGPARVGRFSPNWKGGKLRHRSKYMKHWRTVFPEKYKSHMAVKKAIKEGRLKREPCEVCGNLKTDAHHDDYSKPLEVRWLCRSCHVKLHKDLEK